jgi:hypothetical protein
VKLSGDLTSVTATKIAVSLIVDGAQATWLPCASTIFITRPGPLHSDLPW